MAAECTRNPRILVVKVPYCDTNALGHSKAGPDHSSIVVGLLRVPRRCGGQAGEPNIDLRISDLHTKRDEGVQHAGEGRLARRPPDNEVALEANAVDACTGVLDQLDNSLRRSSFSPAVLDIVIVVIEFSRRIGTGGSLEGDWDI